jgi:hypothetical protein
MNIYSKPEHLVGCTYLQKLFEKGNAICPFVYIIEGIQTFLYLLRVLFVLRIRCESL